MDSSFNNGFPPIRGRPERAELRRPHGNPQMNPVAGDSLQSPLYARPTITMPNSFAAVVAGHAATGDSNSHSQNHNRSNELAVNEDISRNDLYNHPGPMSSSLSPYAKEFVPRGFASHPNDNVEETNDESQVDCIVGYLRDFIYEVTLNPAKFDRNVSSVVQNLKGMINDEQCLNAIVNTLFEQAIQEPNFRYNAARLCSHLCNGTFVFKDVFFRTVLLDKCGLIFENRNSDIVHDPAKLRGFTFFLGELFSQVKVNEMRIQKMAEALPALFETLLQNGNNENYKCVCQMMKFTGPDLEDNEKMLTQGSTPTMDKLIAMLQNTIPNAPRDVQGMMSSVVQLRGCNWGRATSPTLSNSEPVLTEDIPTEAVFYGPDGLPLSAEESLFLENSAQDTYNSTQFDGDDYGDDDDDSEGMDDEIAAAYDEFLRQSGQQ